MIQLSQQELQDKFKKLPEDLQDAIFSENIAETLAALGKKYNLMVDKTGELSSETNYVMLGITHPRDYISNLEKRLGVDRETAKKIAHDINTQIFAKIRESLKKIHGIKEIEKEPPSPKVEMSTPGKPKIPFSELKPKPPPSSFDLTTPVRKIEPSPPPNLPVEEPKENLVDMPKAGTPVQEKIRDDAVFRLKNEVTEAMKESRYPGKNDPYRELVGKNESEPKERAS